MSTTLYLRPMERDLVSVLALFLQRQGCRTELIAEDIVSVQLPHSIHEKQAELELQLYIRLWEVLYGTHVSVLE